MRPSICALIGRVPDTAAIVTSAAFEVLAWNDLAAALMEDFGALAPVERNLARRAFLRPADELARYPADPAVSGLVGDLCDGSPECARLWERLWERHDVRAVPALTKTFRHSVVGELTVDCDSPALTDRDQHLVLYSAPPGSPDAEALALLKVLGARAGEDLP
ncbi:MmyB family transcriptional regulator [Amycolatopsis methanolica]|uniref:MmyB family transcriptional regulator n=1 Tax=Amycolatopsis methanolica TaxID=1814 RepID=UPI0034347206